MTIDTLCAYKKLSQLENKTFIKCETCEGYKTKEQCKDYSYILNLKKYKRRTDYNE